MHYHRLINHQNNGRDRMYRIQENLENTGLQLPVDKVQGPVGGFVKNTFANLKPSKPGGDVNDNC